MPVREFVDVGRVFIPSRAISLPGTATRLRERGIVVASQRRPLWSITGALRLPDVQHPAPNGYLAVKRLLAPYLALLDPALFRSDVIWASITHNERVDDGAAHNVHRMFGTVGGSNGVGSVIAVANTSFTAKTKTDSSIGEDAADSTTNEFTTIGLSRAVGTVQNYSAPASLNGTFSVDVYKSFSASGGGTAHGAALFDSTTVAGSKLIVEDIFGSDAVVVNGDTLNITWTWTH